jgi:hypothetical protein
MSLFQAPLGRQSLKTTVQEEECYSLINIEKIYSLHSTRRPGEFAGGFQAFSERALSEQTTSKEGETVKY